MKFARFTLSLIAVAMLAAPNSAFAGRGLLDFGCDCASQKSCGCATQKGHVVQKGPVVQKGVPQKGHVHQKGSVFQKGCGSSKCGGSCSICLPPVLPALLQGLDSVLNRVFCCDSYACSSRCGGIVQKGVVQKGCATQKGHVAQKGGGCGCNGGSVPSIPSNPFIDDLQPPPIPNEDADARVRTQRHVTRPVSRGIESSTARIIKTVSSTSREPRVLPAELVTPVERSRETRTVAPRGSIIRTSGTSSRGLLIPSNPLR